MSDETMLYAFTTAANPEGILGFIDTVVIPASQSELETKIRNRAKTGVDTEVVFIPPGEWRPPHLKSLDQQELTEKFRDIFSGVTMYLERLGYSWDDLDPGKLISKGFVMPNPVSGRIFFVYEMNKL